MCPNASPDCHLIDWEVGYSIPSVTPSKDNQASKIGIRSPRKKKKRGNIVKLRAKPRLVVLPDWKTLDPQDLNSPSLYINRELSWLEFNQRVLDQALDSRHPLLERVKFLAITGSNLDEFFMIRVATIIKKMKASMDDLSPDGLTTEEQLLCIRERAHKMMAGQAHVWVDVLKPLLAAEGTEFLEPEAYTDSINTYLKDYFKKEIFPVLTPLAFDPGHPFPYMSNLSLNFAVVVKHGKQVKFARVKIPSGLSRFIPIPETLSGGVGNTFVYLEDVIKANLQLLFPGTEIREMYLFRIVRDTDIVIQEDEADDLLESVDKSLKQMRYGAVSLLQVESKMPRRILDILSENFEVAEDVVVTTNERLGFVSWMQLLKIHKPQLKDPAFSPAVRFDPDEMDTIFDRIKIQDQLLHHPYESFSSFETFLKAAIRDPSVVAIKMTLYRLGINSPLVDQLIEAVEAGKQVAVLVELKARFDEKNNIVWAKRLESVGVHVVYGLVNLKTHSKLCLVVRREADGIRRYVHVGTGNYNSATAKVYTDFGMFTAREDVAEDVSEVFNYLTGYSSKKEFNRLLVAPINLRQKLEVLIQNEIDHAKSGLPARIIIKVNAVADSEMIRSLYRASQAGVKIDLIVRGVCCLRPGIPGISDNIRVISVVGRFLEHSRVYYFLNDGDEEFYIGSADLMERNLDRRVEALCPVLDTAIKDQLKTVFLDTILADNEQAYELNTDGTYTRLKPANAETPSVRSQQFFIDFYSGKLTS